MAQIEIILPAMGEGIIEAEVTRWLVGEGDLVEKEQAVVEIATDKVDSDVVTPARGIIRKILLKEGDMARVGQVLAMMETGEPDTSGTEVRRVEHETEVLLPEADTEQSFTPSIIPLIPFINEAAGFQTIRPVVLAHCSPAVRALIKEHQLTGKDIDAITGSGNEGRLTLSDVKGYIRVHHPGQQVKGSAQNGGISEVKDARTGRMQEEGEIHLQDAGIAIPPLPPTGRLIPEEAIYGGPENVVEEMDRMRKIIASHMVYSSHVSPHVSSFIETDVTGLVYLRNSSREEFEKKYGRKLTITPFIVDAVVRAIKAYPRINVSVDGEKIILKQRINIGIAVSLPDGNLIVPVIKDADKLSFPALAARVGELAEKARKQELRPDEIQDGTFTITNLGNFGSLAGTPIINQPEAAILAAGAIRKKPAVIATPAGDAIGIRHLMILSLAYDHRIIDGALGGMFLKQISDNLEQLKEVPD